MRAIAVAFALVLVVSSPRLAGQIPGMPAPPPPPPPPSPGQPQMPARGLPPRPGETVPTGTAIMRGQVTSIDGTPLRRAIVRASAQDGRGGGSASTDAQGKFEIKELPAGRFTVTASKAGYVAMQFGQRRPDQTGTGTMLDVLDKQIVEKITFALPRGGVVMGRVLDEFGEPIAGVQVSAMRSRFLNGARRMLPASSDSTDDQGSFRIYGLAPGEYVISGTLRQQMFAMPGMSMADSDGYAPSYYPGTPNMAEAQRVAVKGGQEVTGVNFALAAAKLARVKGRVTSADGAPAVGMFVMAMSADPTFMMTTTMVNAQTRGDGTFQLAALPPGTYNITARSMLNPLAGEIAQVRVTLSSEDVDNLLLVTSRGAIARGTITSDDGSPLPFRSQLVRIYPVSPDPTPDLAGGMPPTVNDDGTFELSGLFGERMLRAQLTDPGEWFLKGVYLRDQDVADTPVEFVPGQTVEGFQVVFTRKANEVTGVVRDDKSQPALDGTIVVFPSDASRWTVQTRFIRTGRADQSGRYRIRNLPPYDDYRVIAVRDLEEGRFSDPEFLESVRDQATRVSLGDGETKVQDLKITRAQ